MFAAASGSEEAFRHYGASYTLRSISRLPRVMDIETASLSTNELIVRGVGQDAPLGALVRFTRKPVYSDVTTLLDSYQASIIDPGADFFGCSSATTR